MKKFFELQYKDKNTAARLGVMHTAHGDVPTPIFMPVGTQATVKTLDTRDLEAAGAPIILANAYHLHLRPGEDTVAKLGGLHKFMNWPHPILTDSGGFQVFSLGKTDKKNVILAPDLSSPRRRGSSRGQAPAGIQDTTLLDSRFHGNDNQQQKKLVRIDDDGVTFRSHLDGSLHRFTPESAIELQHKLGADIIMAFDQCTSDTASQEDTRLAMERTHHWAKRCLEFHCHSDLPRYRRGQSGGIPQTTKRSLDSACLPVGRARDDRQYLFGIIQGSKYKNLRVESAKFITALDFAGIAIGGESVGFNMTHTKKIMNWIGPYLPEDKPRYSMGVGFAPSDLFAVVEAGIDMFDCVAPTRMARNGALYISPSAGGNQKNKYRLNIKSSPFKLDKKPIDSWCDCFTCQNHTRAYLSHLFRADELLGLRLATIHNVRFMLKLMEEIRAAIAENKFQKLKKYWLK